MSDARRTELRLFLRAMRARLRPSDVGLPTVGSRRRISGLRIEEAAALAGVGLTWYTAFESGKDIKVSEEVLSRIAQSLRLSSEERRYLHALVAPDNGVDVAAPSLDLPDLDARTVAGFTAGPASIADAFWNVLAYNKIADEVYGFASSAESNLLERMFADASLAALHREWPAIAKQMTEIFHDSFGAAIEHGAAHTILDRLFKYPTFVELWKAYGVQAFHSKIATLDHPRLGELHLIYASYVESPARRAKTAGS